MKIQTKPLIFKTLNSLYCYDDSTKNVFPINEIEKDFIEHIQPNQEFTADNPNLSAITNKIERLGLFQKNLISEIPIEDELRNYKLKNGITHLCLILTEACDFRCKYCIYSDNYFYTNSYSSKKMSFDVAKRAIDFYVNINMKAIRYNPNKRFTIGFYGGEPTLCHLTIMKIVEYIKVEYPFIWDNITFLITTNGYSLSRLVNYIRNAALKGRLHFDKQEESLMIDLGVHGQKAGLNSIYQGDYSDKSQFYSIKEQIPRR